MKNFTKHILSFICASIILTGCIDETQPTDVATSGQLGSSSKATEALLWAMPAFSNNVGAVSSDYHYDWGYGSTMIIRDVMTEEMVVSATSYEWYTNWALNKYQGEKYVYSLFVKTSSRNST